MSTNYQISKDVAVSELDDGIVIMSVESGAYYTLHDVAARIWQLIGEQPRSGNQVVELLLSEYHITEAQCRKDVQEFIRELSAKKLIFPQE